MRPISAMNSGVTQAPEAAMCSWMNSSAGSHKRAGHSVILQIRPRLNRLLPPVIRSDIDPTDLWPTAQLRWPRDGLVLFLFAPR